jgi:hypothetical protein
VSGPVTVVAPVMVVAPVTFIPPAVTFTPPEPTVTELAATLVALSGCPTVPTLASSQDLSCWKLALTSSAFAGVSGLKLTN